MIRKPDKRLKVKPSQTNLFSMSEKPKFSILTATFNCARYVTETVNSVQAQTWTNWEMVVVDDASADETFSVLQSLAKDDSRIVIVRNEHRLGCSNTYARVLSMATGEICGVLDGDDVIIPKAMDTVIQLYRRFPKLGHIYTQSWWCDKSLKPKRKGLSAYPDRGNLLLMGMKHRHAYSHWRTFRTCLREKTELFEPNLEAAVDKSLGYRLEEVAPGGFYDRPLYNYRYHGDNLSHRMKQRPVWEQVVSRAVARRRSKGILPRGVSRIS